MPEDAAGGLEAPARDGVDDPGAHDLESSDSEDHFSDAQTGLQDQSGLNSPIPPTRIEKVDKDESLHGDIPDTDASPEEIAVVSEQEEKEGISQTDTPSAIVDPDCPPTVPLTVVEKVDLSTPSHGEVPGTNAYEKRKADAAPDVVMEAPQENDMDHDIAPPREDQPESPASPIVKSPTVRTHNRRKSSSTKKMGQPEGSNQQPGEEDDGFVDDFDDFEEGDEDAEFGDFDTGIQEPETVTYQPQPIQPTAPLFPVLNFDDIDSPDAIMAATAPYIDALFPPDAIDISAISPLSNAHPMFLTQRSASLWSQLVAPPPLQPPNWIRSRIRRLFLVSLGVPVDLDEILPASKQKKLILPSTSLRASFSSSRASFDAATGESIARLKQDDANASNTSLDSQGKPRNSSKRRRGPPPAPDLDLVSARQLCSITDEALSGLTTEELKEHVQKLEIVRGLAKEALDYWTQRTDEKIGDREAFEGVIENLVKHARKVRK